MNPVAIVVAALAKKSAQTSIRSSKDKEGNEISKMKKEKKSKTLIVCACDWNSLRL